MLADGEGGGVGGGASSNESTIRGVVFQPFGKSLNLARLTVLMQFKKIYLHLHRFDPCRRPFLPKTLARN